MLKGSSPIRLSQLDITPALQAGALRQQATANLVSGIQQAVQNFQAKQQEKEQRKMTVNALRQFVPGLGEDVYTAIAKEPQILKSMSDLTKIQAAQQEQEILGQEAARVEEQRNILEKAIVQSTTPSGLVEENLVREAFIGLGGRDESVLGELFDKPGEVKVDKETGIITQDGVYKGQVSAQLLLKGKAGDTEDDETIPTVGTVPTFNTIEEAEAANLPLGTRVIIGGRDAIIG